MKKNLLLCLVGLALYQSSWAQSAQEAVKQADQQLNNLIIQHNVAQAEAFYLPDFILTTSSGVKKLKSDILNEIGLTDLSFEINETTDVQVRVVDLTAILTGVLHQKGQYKGKPFDVRLYVTDTWVNISGSWRIFAGQASVIPSTKPSLN